MKDQNNYFVNKEDSPLEIQFRLLKKKYQNTIDKFMFN